MNYPYIKAWCEMMRSFPYYTEIQLLRAKEENAPEDAIYRRQGTNGGWATFKEIKSDDTKALIEQIVQKYKEEGVSRGVKSNLVHEGRGG